MPTLSPILQLLTQSAADGQAILNLDFSGLFKTDAPHAVERALNAAFLVLLAGETHPDYSAAKNFLAEQSHSEQWADWAKFYQQTAARVSTEVTECCQQNADLASKLERLAAEAAEQAIAPSNMAEAIWSVLFPEGVGITGHVAQRAEQLRQKRTVAVHELNPQPIQNPATQVLFTSNVLLTTPLAAADLSAFDTDFQTQVAASSLDPQRYWYDHPIPVGVPDAANEILYGLQHLDAAVEFERDRNPAIDKVACALSVSVTHESLQALAQPYLKQVLANNPPLERLDIFAFTESDTDALKQEVLLPIISRCCPTDDAAALLSVFGVNGRYGRHYSFLKAITVLWNAMVDPQVEATFKIDLDQVFPQAELVEQTGASAFEHLQTPLWGALGHDADGDPVELGMLAGALVNQRDIHNGVFTPDVTVPQEMLKPDEYVFFSKLPQALSTEAEMMTRYQPGTALDGENACLERIHVTGGTNGILVGSLKKFRPFTPSFIARAEDQAYILSALHPAERLAYTHEPGLIMRHDKEGFAQEAIAMAKVGKAIGDYIRILMFSAYARVLPSDLTDIKALTAPFTGCFISELPITVSLLRFTLKVATLFDQAKSAEALEFMHTGIPQLSEALAFIEGESSQLKQTYTREAKGWQLYYQCLEEFSKALSTEAPWAVDCRDRARKIVANCRVN